MKPIDTSMLPAPLTPADCDLRDFAFMPLDVVRLRDSDLAVTAEADEFRCAVLLWCASWHQVPAASLPDDDKVLAQYAGYGRVVKEWLKVREGALRGWVKCADGRLYHAVVAEKANEAWIAKLRQRLKTECARIKKHNERHGTSIQFPDFEAWRNAGCPVGQPLFVPSDKTSLSPGQDANVPSENHSKGQGEGQGQLTNKTKSSSSHTPDLRDDDPSKESPAPDRAAARSTQIVTMLLAQDVVTTSQNPFVLDWSQDPRITDEVLSVALVKARKAKGAEEVVPKYLAKTIATVLDEQSAAVPATAARGAPVQPIPIRKPQGMDPKGTDESYEEYQARIDAAELARRKGNGA